MLRCRYLEEGSKRYVTLFRCHFYTGFIKLFKLDLTQNELDAKDLPADLRLSCSFTPAPSEKSELVDPYEALIVKESSALWREVLRRKEARMNQTDAKESLILYLFFSRCVCRGSQS